MTHAFALVPVTQFIGRHVHTSYLHLRSDDFGEVRSLDLGDVILSDEVGKMCKHERLRMGCKAL
jgi:hypothetical protein